MKGDSSRLATSWSTSRAALAKKTTAPTPSRRAIGRGTAGGFEPIAAGPVGAVVRAAVQGRGMRPGRERPTVCAATVQWPYPLAQETGMASRFVVGIDLGTTNSALAYVDT